MLRELEIDVETACCALVERMGGKDLKVTSRGRRGRLDRLFIFPGKHIFFVEFKRPRGGRIAALQHKERREWEALGVPCYFCRTVQEFEEILREEIRQ